MSEKSRISGNERVSRSRRVPQDRKISDRKRVSGERAASGDRSVSEDSRRSERKQTTGDRNRSGDKNRSGDRNRSGDKNRSGAGKTQGNRTASRKKVPLEEMTPRERAKEERKRRLRAERARKRGVINKYIAFMFGGFILILVAANFIKPSVEFSESENRMLAQFPEVNLATISDGSFMSGMESYISDQFIARDAWISLKLTEDKLLGKKESNGVYLGKNGYLLGIPDEPNWESVKNNVAAIRDFYTRHADLNIYMTLVPNAFYVMKNKLPANAPIRDQEKDISTVKDQVGTCATFLDVTTALKDHNTEQIYYRTDHHWTSLGAYYAYLAMTGGLGINNLPSSYNIYTVTQNFQGTLASKSGYHGSRDSVQIYEPVGMENEYIVTYEDDMTKTTSVYKAECLNDKDKYTVFFGGNHSLIDIQSPSQSDRVLLIFKDSYANCLIPFLIPHYREIVIVDPRYYYDSIDQVISRRNVTDVLYLYNVDTFLSDTSLADTLAADENGVETNASAPVPMDDDYYSDYTSEESTDSASAEDTTDSTAYTDTTDTTDTTAYDEELEAAESTADEYASMEGNTSTEYGV